MARRVTKERPLSERHVKFAHEYVHDFNATQAAIRSGYSPKGAAVEGSRLLRNPKIQELVKNINEEALARRGITRERTLQHLAAVAYFDPRKMFRGDSSMKSPHEWDEDTAAGISSVETAEMVLNEAKKQEEMDLGGGEDVPDYVERVVTRKVKTVNKIAALSLCAEILGMKRTINPADSGGLSITFVPSTGK